MQKQREERTFTKTSKKQRKNNYKKIHISFTQNSVNVCEHLWHIVSELDIVWHQVVISHQTAKSWD